MNKRILMGKYIRKIKRTKELTSFIAFIFDYDNFNDYNYIFRMKEEDNRIIIDIYDNISDNRFNRYIFNFNNSNLKSRVVKEGNVFVNYINISSLNDCNNKLYKFGYLFKLDKDKMVEYANSFLDKKYVDILVSILK